MNLLQRLAILESRRKPEAVQVAMKRPKISREEWIELQEKTQFRTAAYPSLLRELLTRRGDGSEVLHSAYLLDLEQRFELDTLGEQQHGDN